MKSTSSYIARRLGWDRGGARIVAKALEERGVEKSRSPATVTRARTTFG